MKNTSYNITCVSGCGSAWLERRLREAEVASSNPATPMVKNAGSFGFIELSAFLHGRWEACALCSHRSAGGRPGQKGLQFAGIIECI